MAPWSGAPRGLVPKPSVPVDEPVASAGVDGSRPRRQMASGPAAATSSARRHTSRATRSKPRASATGGPSPREGRRGGEASAGGRHSAPPGAARAGAGALSFPRRDADCGLSNALRVAGTGAAGIAAPPRRRSRLSLEEIGCRHERSERGSKRLHWRARRWSQPALGRRNFSILSLGRGRRPCV